MKTPVKYFVLVKKIYGAQTGTTTSRVVPVPARIAWADVPARGGIAFMARYGHTGPSFGTHLSTLAPAAPTLR